MSIQRGNVEEGVVIRVAEQGSGDGGLLHRFKTLFTLTQRVALLLDGLEAGSRHAGRSECLGCFVIYSYNCG